MTSSPPSADDAPRPGVELERVRWSWDGELAKTLARLDHLVAQAEQALRLTRVFLARGWSSSPR
jgi:hypothetical protein